MSNTGKPGRPRLPIDKLRVKIGNFRVSQTTKATIDARTNPGLWLDSVIDESVQKTRLLNRALAYLDKLSSEGDASASELSDEIRRLTS